MSYSFLNKIFPVLNHGTISVNNLMGTDEDIVKAARTSYQKGTKTTKDDRGLIRYLMRKHHTSPFEQCEISFSIKCPIFIARQWMRHRTANINEMSLRYSEAPDEFFVPDPDTLRKQNVINKQSRSNEHLTDCEKRDVISVWTHHNNECYELYLGLLNAHGVARELSRCVLPVTMYTEFVWKIDLHNLFHFLSLRADVKHAQHEIVEYAKVLGTIIKEWVPIAYEAFEDYRLNAITFSSHELAVLGNMITNPALDFSQKPENSKFTKNEYDEFLEKIEIIKYRKELTCIP